MFVATTRNLDIDLLFIVGKDYLVYVFTICMYMYMRWNCRGLIFTPPFEELYASNVNNVLKKIMTFSLLSNNSVYNIWRNLFPK